MFDNLKVTKCTDKQLIHMKWAIVGIVPRLRDILKHDRDLQEAMMKNPQLEGACGEY